ncbi:MAG: hypothetical protein AB1758_17905 [Candidatus Eremiobacterota bacterium]
MARGSAKKPKPAKSRGSGTPLEGRTWVRIGGSRWLREDAERAGKFIPREYREGYVKPAKAAKAEESPAEATVELEQGAETAEMAAVEPDEEVLDEAEELGEV